MGYLSLSDCLSLGAPSRKYWSGKLFLLINTHCAEHATQVWDDVTASLKVGVLCFLFRRPGEYWRLNGVFTS